ncbi:MAG: hypothetical protein II998_07230 [Clostridia bacterium]|nr:hypothetical protein [Clostridia bacterium]
MFFKKISALLLCVVMCAFCAISANAEVSAEYSIDEIGLKIMISENMYVFTRDVSPDDGRIPEVGYAYEGMMSKFQQENIYLDALATDGFEEIVITSENASEPNYYDLPIKKLYSVIETENAAVETSGRTLVASDLYEHENADFVKIHSLDSSCESIEYITVYNSRKIRIKYIDYDGEISTDADDAFEAVIDSVVFTEKRIEVPYVETPESSDAPDETVQESSAQSEGAQPVAQTFTQSADFVIVVLAILVIVLLLILIFGRRRRR